MRGRSSTGSSGESRAAGSITSRLWVPTHRIVEAIEGLRTDFDQPLRIEDIARELGMSVSGFHHFNGNHARACNRQSPKHSDRPQWLSKQINNVLCFPGIFRGALDVRAREINEDMKFAVARAIAGVIAEENLAEDYIVPSVFDERVAPAVAETAAQAAKESGVAGRIGNEQETGISTPLLF